MRSRLLRSLALLLPAAGLAVYAVACVGDSASGGGQDAADSGGGATDSSSPTGMDGGTPVGSDGGDAGSDASTFTPADLDKAGSLALWLTASSSPADVDVSNGAVAVWKDRSKNHNNASAAANRPTLKMGALGTHDAIHFSDQRSLLTTLDAPSLQFGVDEFAIFAVARHLGTQPPTFFAKAAYGSLCAPACPYVGGMLFTGSGTAKDAGGPGLGLSVLLDTSNTATMATPVFDGGGFHIVGVRRSGTQSMLFYVDHRPVVMNVLSMVDISQPDSGVAIGADTNPGMKMTTPDIDLAEVVAIHAPLPAAVTDATVTQVIDYLALKYGL